LETGFDGNETNFYAPVQGGGDATQHRERVPFVVGIFQATDHRSGRPDNLRELPLAQSRCGSEFHELARDFVGCARFFESGQSIRFTRVKARMKNGKTVISSAR
jgi:hypothetical protein